MLKVASRECGRLSDAQPSWVAPDCLKLEVLAITHVSEVEITTFEGAFRPETLRPDKRLQTEVFFFSSFLINCSYAEIGLDMQTMFLSCTWFWSRWRRCLQGLKSSFKPLKGSRKVIHECLPLYLAKGLWERAFPRSTIMSRRGRILCMYA